MVCFMGRKSEDGRKSRGESRIKNLAQAVTPGMQLERVFHRNTWRDGAAMRLELQSLEQEATKENEWDEDNRLFVPFVVSCSIP